MLLVVKPLRILIFIVVWNILCGVAILLNGGMGSIETPGGYMGFAVAGAFAAFSGFAPVVSMRFRKRWCRPNRDFDEGRFGLILLGSIGSLFAVVGLWSVVSTLTGVTIPERHTDFFFLQALPYGLLIGLVAAFVIVVVRRKVKNRTTTESTLSARGAPKGDS